MSNQNEIFIVMEKPKKNNPVFHYVSEGLLSCLHTEKLQKGYDLKALDSNRRSPLHIASYLDLEAMSLYLLMSGVEASIQDKFGQSAFHVLFAKGSYKTLLILLNYDLFTSRKTLYEWIILLKFGISMQNISLRNTIAMYLSKTLNLSRLPQKPIESKKELKVRIDDYIKKTADRYRNMLCTTDNYRRNPLHYAAMSKFTWCFKVVETAFDDTVGLGSFLEFFKEISALLTPGVVVDPNKYSHVLEEACEIYEPGIYPHIANDLISKVRAARQQAVNAKDINGHTPLHLACLAGDCKIVKLLVANGADKNIRDNTGKKALDLCSTKLVMRYLVNIDEAVQIGDENGVNHLVNSGYNVNMSKTEFQLSSLHLAVLGGHLLKTVLDCEGDVNVAEWNMYTPLHYAAMTGKAEDVNMLVKEGANVMSLSAHKLTPLHLACKFNKVQAIQALLKHSAKIDAKDHHGCTPLMIAAKNGSFEAVRELLTARCDNAAVDQRKWNALHYASFHSKAKVVKLLVKWDADTNVLRNAYNSQGKVPLALTSHLLTRKAFDSKI